MRSSRSSKMTTASASDRATSTWGNHLVTDANTYMRSLTYVTTGPATRAHNPPTHEDNMALTQWSTTEPHHIPRVHLYDKRPAASHNATSTYVRHQLHGCCRHRHVAACTPHLHIHTHTHTRSTTLQRPAGNVYIQRKSIYVYVCMLHARGRRLSLPRALAAGGGIKRKKYGMEQAYRSRDDLNLAPLVSKHIGSLSA